MELNVLICMILLSASGCTTFRNADDIAKNIHGEPTKYATESHFWMVPRTLPPEPKQQAPVVPDLKSTQQDGYTSDACHETDKTGENRVCN